MLEVLGCHQVLVDGDILRQIRYIAELLGIETVEPHAGGGLVSVTAQPTEQQIQPE